MVINEKCSFFSVCMCVCMLLYMYCVCMCMFEEAIVSCEALSHIHTTAGDPSQGHSHTHTHTTVGEVLDTKTGRSCRCIMVMLSSKVRFPPEQCEACVWSCAGI